MRFSHRPSASTGPQELALWLQSSVRAAEGVCMRSAFQPAWWTSAACAFVLLTACSQAVSPDGPAEVPIETPSPSGPVEAPSATPSPSNGFIRYQDPDGYFAVSYPVGWNVHDFGTAAAFTPGPKKYSFPFILVGVASFTTEPQNGEPPKVQVRQQFEDLGFLPGSRMLDEGPAELDGERAYYGAFVEYSAGFPIAHLLIVSVVGDWRYSVVLQARGPRNFGKFLPLAWEMADSLEIQG